MPKTSIKSKHGQVRRRALVKRRVWMLALAVIGITVLSVILLRSSAFTLGGVELHGATEDQTAIVAAVENILNENFLFFVPKRSIIFLPRRHIAAELLRRFPRLLEAKVNISSSADILKITVAERERFSLWCRDKSRVEECFYIDDNGVVFAEAPTFSGSVLFTYRGGMIATSSSALGRRIMAKDEFSEVGAFISELTRIGFVPRGLTVQAFGYEIWLNRSSRILVGRDTLITGLDKIKTTIKSGDLRTDDDFLKTVEYIDLRFENRIYYKYR